MLPFHCTPDQLLKATVSLTLPCGRAGIMQNGVEDHSKKPCRYTASSFLWGYVFWIPGSHALFNLCISHAVQVVFAAQGLGMAGQHSVLHMSKLISVVAGIQISRKAKGKNSLHFTSTDLVYLSASSRVFLLLHHPTTDFKNTTLNC